MNAVIGVSLAVIALILFYRVVERRHKILLGKIVLGISVLVAAVVVILWRREAAKSERAEAIQRSVAIAFLPDSAYRAKQENPFLALLAGSDTAKEISFELCNKGKDTVTEVNFRPVTAHKGRSTQEDVLQSTSAGYQDPYLKSDYILKPGDCTRLTWTATGQHRFVLLDTVIATVAWLTTKPE